jgi:AraC-like DNA-binding protein
MPGAAGDFGSFRLSAQDLRPRERLALYRDLMDRTMEKADIDSVGDEFSFGMRICRLPDLDVVRAKLSPTRVWRGRELASGGEKLFFMRLLEGAATLAQLGKEATISGGSAILFSAAAPVRIERTRSRFLLIGIPRALLEPMIASPASALMAPIPGTTEAVRLLTSYVALFSDDAAIEAQSLRQVIVHHVHDLVALAIGSTRDAAQIACGRGLRAARLRAIKADIAQNLDGRVTADTLASRHGVSPRYIRSLFEGEKTSLSRFVLGQRLVRAHRMLTDARHAHLTISAIAFLAGFRDLSTFNLQFRRRFGATPSQVRFRG